MSIIPKPTKWISEDGRFLLGKHKGELIETVSTLDHSYINYIVNNFEDMDEEDREILSQHLKYSGGR